MPKNTSLPVRLLADLSKENLSAWKADLHRVELSKLELHDVLHYRDAAARTAKAIQTAQPSELQALLADLAKFTGPGAELASQAAHAYVHTQSLPTKSAALEVLNEAETLVEGYKAEAVAAEKSLCEDFGVPYSPTAASQKFDAVLATIRGYKEDLNKPTPTGALPSHTHPFLAFIGMDLEQI